mmetsp:Transcript_12945/g.16541  ORF Transcript_12945/g.16541 Transcript_12945/m.16541 type:complete len:85 (+) Transcript_12945:89-343(+)
MTQSFSSRLENIISSSSTMLILFSCQILKLRQVVSDRATVTVTQDTQYLLQLQANSGRQPAQRLENAVAYVANENSGPRHMITK